MQTLVENIHGFICKCMSVNDNILCLQHEEQYDLKRHENIS